MKFIEALTNLQCPWCGAKIDLLPILFFHPSLSILLINSPVLNLLDTGVKDWSLLSDSFVKTFSRLLNLELFIYITPAGAEYPALIVTCSPECKNNLVLEISNCIHDKLRELGLFDSVLRLDSIPPRRSSFLIL